VLLSWEEVRARRLARSRLTDRADSVVEAVRSTCGIQAQLQTAAELGIGIRTADAIREDVRRALWVERTLVRTWTLRGTLHVHPADELGLWTAAAGDQLAETGLDVTQRARLLDAFADALDGRTLLREELAAEVAGRVGEWAREPLSSGWAFLVGDAVAAGILCSGPPQGTKVTFVRADQWLGPMRVWTPREALLEATRRFLRAHGPIAAPALAFLGVKGTDARQALLDELRTELVPVDVEGAAMWLLADDAGVSDFIPSVRLLPQYDCYVLGFREREHLVGPEAKELYWDTRWKKEGRYESPVALANVIVDGRVAGTWERRLRGGLLAVELRLAEPLSPVQREELEREASRVATILGAESSLVTLCY
jgi:DNA glycosylase AlkZ-like